MYFESFHEVSAQELKRLAEFLQEGMRILHTEAGKVFTLRIGAKVFRKAEHSASNEPHYMVDSVGVAMIGMLGVERAKYHAEKISEGRGDAVGIAREVLDISKLTLQEMRESHHRHQSLFRVHADLKSRAESLSQRTMALV